MSAIVSKNDICNLALSYLGSYGTVTDIDSASNDTERVFALWYDITRQVLIKETQPNFARARRLIAELETTIPFGYAYAFEVPSDSLKVLGIGEIADTGNYIYAVEGNVIYTDDEWGSGLQLRYLKNETVVSNFSPEFVVAFAYLLAANTALPITQDDNKRKLLEQMAAVKANVVSSLSGQENKIVRISNSYFKKARNVSGLTHNTEQK